MYAAYTTENPIWFIQNTPGDQGNRKCMIIHPNARLAHHVLPIQLLEPFLEIKRFNLLPHVTAQTARPSLPFILLIIPFCFPPHPLPLPPPPPPPPPPPLPIQPCWKGIGAPFLPFLPFFANVSQSLCLGSLVVVVG